MSKHPSLADALRHQFSGSDRSTVDHIIHMPDTTIRRARQMRSSYLWRSIITCSARSIPNPDRDIDQLIAGWDELPGSRQERTSK